MIPLFRIGAAGILNFELIRQAHALVGQPYEVTAFNLLGIVFIGIYVAAEYVNGARYILGLRRTRNNGGLPAHAEQTSMLGIPPELDK